MVGLLDALWLIPVCPLVTALLMLAFGARWEHRQRPLIGFLCCGSVLVSFVLSLLATWELAGLPGRTHESVIANWLPGLPFPLWRGGTAVLQADWGFLLDPLSSVLILVVTGIGLLIHIYSVGYMSSEGGYYRYFGYLNLFIAFMLLLALANNYLLLFVGWEGVGFCSYLLISFYFHRVQAVVAGNKAFVMNRIGDAAFLLGIMLMFSLTGSVRFTQVQQVWMHGGFTAEIGAIGVLSVLALLLFAGATGKSAQFPLFTWLPDAMAGPTPVSALIHAATMVTAGVYVIARSSALYQLTPHVTTLIGVVGALTAVLAAAAATAQADIKRVLAYSTISQLGYMFMALGAGAYWAAVFHLFTHAFFKALLFLGAGTVIHSLHGEQNLFRMGGLWRKLPRTHAAMLVAALAIAGVPGLAGFFSKDEILWRLYASPLGFQSVFLVGLATSFLTSFYMGRLMALAFYGESRLNGEHHAHHERAPVIVLPLALLALGTVLAGWLGVPHQWTLFGKPFRSFEFWLEPVFPAVKDAAVQPDTWANWLLMGSAFIAPATGLLLARALYIQRTPDQTQARGFRRVLQHGWFLDRFYLVVVERGLVRGLGRLLSGFDRRIVDGLVNRTGRGTRRLGSWSNWSDRWVVDGLVRVLGATVRLGSYPVRLLQTGRLQSYALAFVVGVLTLLGYLLVRG